MYSVTFTSSKYMQVTLYLFCITNDTVRVPYLNEVMTEVSFIIFQILIHHIIHIKANTHVEISDICKCKHLLFGFYIFWNITEVMAKKFFTVNS